MDSGSEIGTSAGAGRQDGRYRRRMRFWSRRLIAVLGGTLLALILVEIFVRIAFPLFPYTIQAALREVRMTPFSDGRILPQQIWQADDHFQFVSRANVQDEMQFPDPRVGFHVTTMNWLDPNSHVGFRVPSADWEPHWPVDAVIVGDSFSFCYTEYSACWVQRLDDEYGMSVVNLGQVATGSISHLNILQTFGLPYEPRIVLWQWYGNDFNDDYGMAVQNGTLEALDAPGSNSTGNSPAQVQVPRWIKENSASYWLLRTVTSSAEDLDKYRTFVDPFEVDVQGTRIWFGRPYTLEAFDMSNPKNQAGLALTKEAILRARDLLSEQSSVLAIILIPSKEGVYRPWMEATLGSEQIDALSVGRQEMMAFCADQGLYCLDTTAAMTAAALQGDHLYHPDDTHLNDLGNALLATAVWEWLTDLQLVSSES